MNRIFVVSVFLVALVAVACGAPAATPTAAPSPTTSPTVTTAPTATAAAEPTATPAASPSEEPSATASAEPTPTDGASPSASAGAELVVETDPSGAFLVGTDGFSLYVFDSDEPSVSNCSGECADNWPPFTSDGQTLTGGEGITGTFATITRDDSSVQITYNDAPL
ncbi:MAG: COG4315 family predicted lipoprotein, partial [Aeromicrobium sp.]